MRLIIHIMIKFKLNEHRNQNSNRIPYKTAINILEKRVDDVKNGLKKEFIWVLEHPTILYRGY